MILVEQLSKSYGSNRALDELSLQVKEGSLHALLGPNGAGKSTTINILSTLLIPDSGRASISGLELFPDRSQIMNIRSLIGVVSQDIALYEDLTAIENLKFWGSLYGIPKNDLIIRANLLLNDLGLAERKNDKVLSFSGGMKRRLNIAAALLHDPPLIFMDEPTVGVDPHSRNHIFVFLEKKKQEGKTIVYTTHYMEEAEKLADKISIIDAGKVIAEGTLHELKLFAKETDVISIEVDNASPSLTEKLSNLLQHDVSFADNNRINISGQGINRDLGVVLQHTVQCGFTVKHVDVRSADLETVFLSLTGKSLRD